MLAWLRANQSSIAEEMICGIAIGDHQIALTAQGGNFGKAA